MNENGSKLVLKEVRHVPEMRLNLISTGKLDEVGMTNQFVAGRWKLSRGSMVIAQGKKEGSLYIMQEKICKEQWIQPWPMGSKIFPEVHENPKAFFSSSGLILLEPLSCVACVQQQGELDGGRRS